MSPISASTVSSDADMTREQLLSELQELRAQVALLKDADGKSRSIAEALRESEKKYRDLVENANSIIIRWDMRGNITFFNEFAEEFFGYPACEVLGRNVVGTIVPVAESTGRNLAAMVEEIKRYPGSYKTNVNENICRNGERVWISWTNRAILDADGKVFEILSVGNDITERKRAEKALMLTQFSIDKFTDSVIWTRMDGRIVYVNETACSRLGYSREELLSMYIWDVNRNYPADKFHEILEGVKRHGGSLKIESSHVKRDGTEFPIDLTISYIKYENVEHLIGIDRDITGRKQAEKEVMSAKSQAELYLDLMGHDINNMHQIALGYLELASGMPPGEEQAAFINKSAEVLRRSTMLIQNVRKLQKLREGVFQAQDIDVCRVLTDVQREFGSVPHKQVINVDVCGQCRVRANELLHDVFANLVSNAIKHTGDRAIIIVGLDAVKDHDIRYCRVVVEDDGPGIPDEFKATIFNRALKGTNKAKGMGLGLYLVKSLVESYGGRVWVEDRIKGDHAKGARFVVMLPAIDQ